MENEISRLLRSLNIKHTLRVSGEALTTFGSGGEVTAVAYPNGIVEVIELVKALEAHSIKWQVLGFGSNVLISDLGYDGVIISLSHINDIAVRMDEMYVSAGVSVKKIANVALDSALSGVEFLSGIPARFGGACFTNAGAFGSEISDVISSITVLKNGEIAVLERSDLNMTYHNGGLDKCVVLNGKIRLTRGKRESIESIMRNMQDKRAKTQPQEPSAGSVFAKVGDVPSALYIELTGLKGIAIGGAKLSEKHCNFIVNIGGSTTTDFIKLSDRVAEQVNNICGVKLRREVEIIGE